MIGQNAIRAIRQKRRVAMDMLAKRRRKERKSELKMLSLQIQQANPELFNLIQKLGK